MKKRQFKPIYILFLLPLLLVIAWKFRPQSAEKQIFREAIQKCEVRQISDCVADMGRFFLEKPYTPHTLEKGEKEDLVVNLQEFDCVTLIENALALAQVSLEVEPKYSKFTEYLQQIRYRNGKIAAYPSRLHYFSDWIYDNQQKGFVKDITASLGGIPYKKAINYMTEHRDAYPQLKEELSFLDMRMVEREMSKRTLFYIPKEKVQAVQAKIQEGDIISITTSVKGLDVSHEGIAIKLRGQIYLLHASSDANKVVVSDEPLYQYLAKNKAQTGIMVCRVKRK